MRLHFATGPYLVAARDQGCRGDGALNQCESELKRPDPKATLAYHLEVILARLSPLHLGFSLLGSGLGIEGDQRNRDGTTA